MPLVPSSYRRSARILAHSASARFWCGGSELERRLPAFELRHLGHVAAEWPQRIGGLAREEPAASALRAELAVLYDDRAACQHRDRPAFQLAAFVRRVAGLVARLLDHQAFLRVPDRDVRI